MVTTTSTAPWPLEDAHCRHGTAPFLFLLETRNLFVEKFEGGDRQLLLASSRKVGQPGPQL